MGETIAARFGAEPRAPIDPPTIDEIELREPRVARPTRSRTCAPPTPKSAPAHLRQVVPRRVARAAPRLLAAARPRRDPARRARRGLVARLVQRRADRRDPLRRRLVGGRRRRVRRRRRLPRRGQHRPAALDQVVEVDRTSRAARAGRHLRPRARRPTAAARPDAAALPAVVRVLDARRVARDPLRRPLRDAAHAHRRLRRVDPGGHAARRVGEPAPPRAPARGRRPTACCSARKARSA